MEDKLILISASAMLIALALGAQPAESRTTLHSNPGAAIGTPGAANKANPIPVQRNKTVHRSRSEMTIPDSHLKLINGSHFEPDPTK
jgi:hypothetical protein